MVVTSSRLLILFLEDCGEVGDDAPDAGATMGPFRAALEAEVAAYVSKQYGKGR